jgi:hypothetical protein
MAGLSPAFPPGRRSRWLSLQADRVGGRRLGGVGGIELQPGLKIAEPLLQFRDPCVEGVQEGQKGSLGFRWHSIPERFGDGRPRDHDKSITKSLYKRFRV